MGNLMTLAPLILLIVIMYFLLIRPQKKREKQVNAMRSAVKVGDDIITIGGICGKVVKTKDDTLIIQVGADKTKFEVMRWSISKVVNEEPGVPSKKPIKETEPEDDEPAAKKTLPKKLKKTPDSAESGQNPADTANAQEMEQENQVPEAIVPETQDAKANDLQPEPQVSDTKSND